MNRKLRKLFPDPIVIINREEGEIGSRIAILPHENDPPELFSILCLDVLRMVAENSQTPLERLVSVLVEEFHVQQEKENARED